MPYSVPPLPYDYAALEPHIDEQTMRIHHDKHHQAYVDKVNARPRGHRVGRQADRGRHPRPPEDSRGQARRRPQPRRRAPQPHAVLELHEPAGRRRAERRPRGRDRREVRLLRRLQGRLQGRRRQPVRLRLGLARQRRRRASRSSRRPIRTTRSRTAWRRCSASTSGSTPTTSSTRTAVRTTSPPGGTSSTGRRRPALRRLARRVRFANAGAGATVAPAQALTRLVACGRMAPSFPS